MKTNETAAMPSLPSSSTSASSHPPMLPRAGPQAVASSSSSSSSMSAQRPAVSGELARALQRMAVSSSSLLQRGEEEEEEEGNGGMDGGCKEAAFQSFLEENNAPDDMICPLSLSLMLDPVTAADSFSYERKHLEAHIAFAESKEKLLLSPLTNLPMAPMFIPSMFVKRQVQAYVDEKREEWEEGGRR